MDERRWMRLVNGEEVPMSQEEIDAHLAEEIAPTNQASLSERLNAIFDQQPVSVRAQFMELKAAIKLALEQGDIEVAKFLVQSQTVPDYLVPAQQQMLQEFQ